MIKYDEVQNTYIYKREDIDRVLDMLQNGDFYRSDNCTQEKVAALVKCINDFMQNIDVVPQTVVAERHETEEEAREYFGSEFISQFDQLLTMLDKQETIVALHGTSVNVCPMICETGLQYTYPSLGSTAVQQEMAFGRYDMHYDDYEGLLNWGHKLYKGLVILAIPYECFYREGLWNHFAHTDTAFYGGQDYRIDPDFVVGYIDVENKKIVLNPKYNRQHNYAEYVEDNELFRENLDFDNEKFKQAVIDFEELFRSTENQVQIDSQPTIDEKFDVSRIGAIVEEFVGTFNSIKLGFPDGMTESRYRSFLNELSYGFGELSKAIPLLKTDEQVRKENQEQEERFAMFNTSQQVVTGDDVDIIEDMGDFDWEDDFDWGTPVEESSGKTL